MGVRLLKISAVYFAIASLVGLYNYFYGSDFGVIASLHTFGWVTLALAGIIYHLFPNAAQTGLAQTFFWLYNIGFPVGVIGGLVAVSWLSGIGTIATLVGILVFFVSVLKDIKG